MIVARILLFICLLVVEILPVHAEAGDWIHFRSIGTGIHHYSGQARQYTDHYIDDEHSRRLTVHFDSLGFYRRLGSQPLLFGGLLNTSLDRIRSPHSIVYLARFRVSASSQYYFGADIGSGFFLRGDLSVIRSLIAHDPYFHPEYLWGAGLLLGGGYGIPLLGTHHLLFHVHWSPELIDGEYESSLGIKIGWMF